MAASWEYGATAFLDVLGFSDFVNGDAASTSPEHLSRLVDCLAEVRATTPVNALDLRAFSDSIVLSAPLTPDAVVKLILSTVGLQRVFLRRSILVRGGIALGKHFANEDLVYSEALIRAYHLERDHARFPRILMERNLLDWFMNDEQCSAELKGQVLPAMLKDRDDQVFLHYLCPEIMDAHAAVIGSYRPSDVTASVLEKIQWLAAYHNHYAKLISHQATIGGQLVEGFRAL